MHRTPQHAQTRRAVIVCVHGAGGGGWEWGIWARVLGARGYEVIAPDLQPVSAGIAETRLDDYRDQVAAWCSGVGAPVVLVGASLGGLLALRVADAVAAAALILINPLPPAAASVDGQRRRWPAVVPWARNGTLAQTRRAMGDADDAARLYAFRRWRDESGAVLEQACAGGAVESVECPVCVFASELDEDVPVATSRALAASLAADFEVLPATTHVGPLLGRDAAVAAERAADWLAARLPNERDRAEI
jgi:pimeloyl-ACP methyl ester carboxylesterase